MVEDNSEEYIIAEAIAADKAIAEAIVAANARITEVYNDGHKTLIDQLVDQFGAEAVANWDGSDEMAIVGAINKPDSPNPTWVLHETVMENLDVRISRLQAIEDNGPDEEFMDLLRSGEFLNTELPVEK